MSRGELSTNSTTDDDPTLPSRVDSRMVAVGGPYRTSLPWIILRCTEAFSEPCEYPCQVARTWFRLVHSIRTEQLDALDAQ